MKVRPRTLSKEQNIEVHDSLYTAASSLKGREAMKLFLRDLLTPSERVMLGRRIVIARKLLAGLSHQEIRKQLQVGQHTVERVYRWLGDQFPGYEQALQGMEREYKKRAIRHGDRKRFAALKRKYPLHFLLFPWPKGYKPKGW